MKISNFAALQSNLKRRTILHSISEGVEVMLLPMSAADAVAAEEMKHGETGNVFEFAKSTLSKYLVNEEGEAYATPEQLDTLPVDILLEIFQALIQGSLTAKKN